MRTRPIGVVYLLFFVWAITAVVLTKGLVVSGDAAATAANILAHETRYRASIAVGLIGNLLYLALTALLYRLFEPVDRTLSLVAALFSVAGCVVQLMAALLEFAPLELLENSPSAALASLHLYSRTFQISFVCFAAFELVLGYVMIKATFLPRILGVLMMVAGLAWMTFIWPPLATSLFSVIVPVGVLAELAFMGWLLVKTSVPGER
jgi:uncharacterized protein DUF4386